MHQVHPESIGFILHALVADHHVVLITQEHRRKCSLFG